MNIHTCLCGDKCFFITKLRQNNKGLWEDVEINKCAKLLSDKKKPCEYYNEKIKLNSSLNEKETNGKNTENTENTENKENKNVNTLNTLNTLTIFPKKEKTYNDYKKLLDDMLEFYYIKSTNYFGKLNYYLKILGYDFHLPNDESLEELKIRIQNRTEIYDKNKKILKIYTDEKIMVTQTIGEYDFDLEEEEKILERIKNKENILDWTDNEYLQSVFNDNKMVHKNKKKYRKNNLNNLNTTEKSAGQNIKNLKNKNSKGNIKSDISVSCIPNNLLNKLNEDENEEKYIKNLEENEEYTDDTDNENSDDEKSNSDEENEGFDVDDLDEFKKKCYKAC
jgi:hypothetical protein